MIKITFKFLSIVTLLLSLTSCDHKTSFEFSVKAKIGRKKAVPFGNIG